MRVLRQIAKKLFPTQMRPHNYLERLVRNKTGAIVFAGPFKGMKYVDRAFSSQLIPKLLGTYEKELHAVFDQCFKLKFDTVIDVGAAEGYYAVGFAIRKKDVSIIAFESDTDAAEQLARLANKNECGDRVNIRGHCTVAGLAEAIHNGSNLVICDCEGFEVELLNPQEIPALAKAYILVEMHDFIVPGATEELLTRFCRTHVITRIVQETRTRNDFPFQDWYVRLLPEADVAPNEGRPVLMHWLWMEPKKPDTESK